MMEHDVELGPNADDPEQVVVRHAHDEVVVPEEVILFLKTFRCKPVVKKHQIKFLILITFHRYTIA